MLNIESLQEVETVNSRVNYDLRFSATTGKFTLGANAYTDLDINNNGFKLLRTPDGDAVLKVVPNEQAKMHPGRSDADRKGKTFTADGLAAMLGVEEGAVDAEYTFEKHEQDGDIFLTLTRIDDNMEEDTDVTFDTEDTSVGEPVGNVPAGQDGDADNGNSPAWQ